MHKRVFPVNEDSPKLIPRQRKRCQNAQIEDMHTAGSCGSSGIIISSSSNKGVIFKMESPLYVPLLLSLHPTPLVEVRWQEEEKISRIQSAIEQYSVPIEADRDAWEGWIPRQ